MFAAVFTSAAAFAAGSNLEQMLTSGAAVQYQRVVFYDQELNCEAGRSIAPVGWKLDGQVNWSMQSGAAPAVATFFIKAPDESAMIGFVSPMSFAQPDPIYRLTDGQWHSATVSPVKTYQNAETYARSFFMELTKVPNVQVISVRYPEGEMLRGIQDYVSALQKESDTLKAQSEQILRGQNATMSIRHGADAAEVTLRFVSNGVSCKAKAFVIISAYELINTTNIPYVGQHTERSIGWNTGPLGFHFYIAEEQCYDQHEAVADVFFQNIIGNEQWGSSVRRASEEIFKRQLEWTWERVMQQQEHLKRLGAQYVAQSARNYYSSSLKKRSDAISRAMEGWNNVITDREYYDGPDGGYVSLDSRYSHTYSDGSGGYIQSQRPMELPYGWNEVSSIGTMPPRR